MDKTHMEPAEYFAYLPVDSIYPPYVATKES